MNMSKLERKRATLLILVLLLLSTTWGGGSCRGPGRERRASLILENGFVWTMDGTRPQADCLALDGEKILYVGTRKGAERFRGGGTEVIDLSGRMVLPAFQDSHVHLISGGIELGQCDLNGRESREAVFEAVRSYAEANPDKPWITGGGWDLPIFPAANPAKEDLDSLVPDRPAFLVAADGHSSWANSAALKIAGITKATPDPEGGRIERHPLSGEPTGTLRETASGLVSRHIPQLLPEDYVEGLKAGSALAARFGITSIIEASAGEEILGTYTALDRSGDLTLRVRVSLTVDPKGGASQIARLVGLRDAHRSPHVVATTAKIFADGVLESHTAALLEPYLDLQGERGPANIEPDEFNLLASALEAAGFDIHVHAIGDRAVRMSLDALEAARKANGPAGGRHHLAHLELIHPDDIGRFRELGVTANFQALWAYPDSYITDLTEPILGPDRSRRLYPIGSVVRSGARIVGGSDWSVSSMNPLDAIQVAVTRRALDDPDGPSWIPEEVVGLETMLAAYTVNGAWLSREEDSRGSLEPGMSADLIVLDRNLFLIPPAEIHKTRVLLTLFEGREVYRDPALIR
jgi:predicted amidohydrolase YtcJ